MNKCPVFVLLFCCLGTHAQTVTDRIFLNDSTTVYEGLMVEQAPARYIKIFRLKEKDTIQVMMKDIWKMVKVYPVADTPKQKLPPPPVKKPRERNARTAFAELMGNAIFYSANFEQRLHKKNTDGWGLRAGLTVINGSLRADSGTARAWLLGIPLGVNHLLGEKNHFLEAGAGVTYFFKLSVKGGAFNAGIPEAVANDFSARFLRRDLKTSRVTGNFTLGYRYISSNNGLMIGVAFIPVIGHHFFLPHWGLKLGYQF
jgi:hypothetical protein